MRAQDGAVWDVQVLMRLLAMFRGKKKLSLCHKFRKFDAPLSPLRSMLPAPYRSKTRHILTRIFGDNPVKFHLRCFPSHNIDALSNTFPHLAVLSCTRETAWRVGG